MKFKTKDLVMISIGITLIAIGAIIKIPSPIAGYFTLQLPFVIMISIVLGSKRAFYAAMVYMLGGLLGIPWFAGGGGFMYIAKPTFGFILAFAIGALIAGRAHNISDYKRGYFYTILACVFIWTYGMLHYTFILRVISGADMTYFAFIGAVLSPDFYIDIALAVIFTKIGFRINRVVEV
jgi:biotin transport system substrate-specific component